MTGTDSKNGGKASKNTLLRWIAVFKLLKAISMVFVGIGVLKLAGHNSENSLDQLVQRFGVDPGRKYVDMAIGKLVNIRPERLKEVGFASFVYAGLFLTEGIGLWLGKRWAEWFTVIITFSLVPLEVYELVHKPTAGKVVVLLFNLAVAVYLIVRIRREKKQAAGDR